MDAPPSRRRLRTWALRLLAAAAALLLLAAALVAAAPWLARPALERALSAALERPVAIAALRWEAAQRSLLAEGVAMGEPPDQLTVERVSVRVSPFDLDRRHLVVERLAVDGLAGGLSIDPRLDAGSGDAAGFTPPALPLALTVRELTVGEGTVRLHRPRPDAPAATVRLQRLVATDASLIDGVLAFAAELEAQVNDAPLAAQASVRLAPDDRAVRATLTARQVPVRAGLLPLPAAIESLTGTLAATAELEITDQPPRQQVTVAARLADARLRAAGGADLAAALIALPAARADLLARRLDLGEVTVEQPRLSVDLAAAPPPPAAGDGPPWSLRSGAVSVRGGELRAQRGDAVAGLRLDTLRWQGLRDAGSTLQLRARGDGGGQLEATGTVRAEPLGVDLALTVERLSVVPWARLLPLPLQPARGTLSGSLRLEYDDRLRRLEGRLRAEDLHSLPPDPARPIEVLAVASATASFALVPGERPAVEVSALELDYPYAMVVRGSAGTFPYSILAAGGGGGDDAPALAAVRVRRLAIDGGKLEFVDQTLAPPFWTSLTGLSGTAEEIALPELTVARFALSGRRDELSPVQLAGALTADGLQGRVEARDILLDSLNAYVAPALGYRIVAGRLSTVATATTATALLQSTAEVVLQGLDVTQIGADAIYEQSGVPLPIALGLIASPGGRIDLTLPLSLDTRSGRVSVGSVVWQAVRKAIVTALTSPLRILGSLFGRAGAPHAFAVDPIPFAAGSAALDDTGARRIGEIARILAAQPGLLLILQPQLTAADLAAAGDAAALAAERGAAARDAFVDGEQGPSLPAERVIVAPWQPGRAVIERPGVYVELQEAG